MPASTGLNSRLVSATGIKAREKPSLPPLLYYIFADEDSFLNKQCLRLFGVLFNCKCTGKTQYHSIESFHSNISCGDFSMLECYFQLKFIEQIIVSHLFCLKSMTLIVNSNLLGYKGITYRLVFGVAFIEDVRERLRKFGDRAALARQSIKGNALQHIAFYEEGMKNSVLTGKYIEDHMEQALENHEFVMYLQPKYSMQSGKMVGAEALVRWIQPGNGIVPPVDFIPVFEKNGFVTKMDAYIWEEACKTIRSWIDEGWEPLPISVNVSRIHLKDNQFIDVLNHLIEKYQISKNYLEIELTETADSTQISEGISLLKDSGYTLLMDDFGSGYSSLNTLKDTQFDVIKIDRGFLQDFIGSERGQKIVEHTIQMTKSIGLDLVAEGVETKEQAQFLMGCGCDTAQGFYYAKPMTVEQFNELMKMQ